MAPRGCSTPRCNREHHGRLSEHPCVGHRPEPPLLADQLAARGWDVIGDCWVLHGVPNANGYLYVGNGGRRLTAARAAYEAWREPVHANQVIDSTCCNGACINPMHLVLRRITRRTCSIRGCTREHYGRTLCRIHYGRLMRAGKLDARPADQRVADGDAGGAIAPHWLARHRRRVLDLGRQLHLRRLRAGKCRWAEGGHAL